MKKNENKELSCGFIIFHRSTKRILACHPTGRSYKEHNWDIPKGHIEKGENVLQAAFRELKEETGISLEDKDPFLRIGLYDYTPKKNLYLFAAETDFDIENLKCTTYFEKDGKVIPEMNNYILTDNVNLFYKNLCPIINKIYSSYLKIYGG